MQQIGTASMIAFVYSERKTRLGANRAALKSSKGPTLHLDNSKSALVMQAPLQSYLIDRSVFSGWAAS
ncbi:hypothetical protein MES5069_420071 [Mesorhizobium escarrei]|uniref:Transposase n=1 Tax=Mesorhizobium escarrei TaxID=666018 RepID=A0ABN8K7F6_9HYPH|nr:hypothetical protein MES5069_420071 [Mesorhizobium escarrei]